MVQMSSFRASVSGTKFGRQATVRVGRRCSVVAYSKFQLKFIGDGTSEHLELDGATVTPPDALELNIGVYELGRVAPADIIIDVPTVSSRHALLRVEEDSVMVTDLNSTNGTYMNGEEVKPMAQNKLELENEIYFGD